MHGLSACTEMSQQYWTFNDFFEQFFSCDRMIVRRTSLTMKDTILVHKFQLIHSFVFNQHRIKIIHTGSEIYIQPHSKKKWLNLTKKK